ncbi:Protein XRP2 [Toxocara canis]|uniref:Protein XRP2 n=1 Tax=Toxocara canis TaxID=6265 RepID=A0A0B2VJP6_TOXCA|nr:Protein XRP2 [Toxocara canis]
MKLVCFQEHIVNRRQLCTCVFIRDCASCTIFTISQQFRSRDCIDIDVFIFCATRPIIESSRLMRFRPLSLYYDKLEEHMLKATISPFTNNWNAIHDFTPEDMSNFEICPMSYDTIENMELVSNLEKVKFCSEMSFFPQCVPLEDLQQKVSLLLCKQLSSESLENFYRRALSIQRELLTIGAKIVTTRDVSIRKGEMFAIFESKHASKYSGRIVSMEIACEPAVLKKFCEAEGDLVELIGEEDFARYRTSLHRLADIQMDV